ncbi:unnamed protein product, partial [marine sediment metagenome]
VDVHTDAGTYVATMGSGGIYTANVEVFECPVDSIWAEAAHAASGCSNSTQASPVPPDPSGITTIDLGIGMTKSHLVLGTITYLGVAQAGLVVEVTTDVGMYPVVLPTNANGYYEVLVDVFECPVDSIWVRATEPVSGCTDISGPVPPDPSGTTTIDVDIFPPKAHTVSGTVSYHGMVQAGIEVEATTSVGLFPTGGPATTDVNGNYSIVVQIFECPIDSIWVRATEPVSGCTETSASVPPDPSGTTTIDLDIALPNTHTVSG